MTIGGFSKYAVEEELLEHSPAAHARRPRLDYESHATALDRNELGAILVAAGLGPPAEHALVSLLALNGLRVPEATGADVEDLGLERATAPWSSPARAARSSLSHSPRVPPGRLTWRSASAPKARCSSPRTDGGWTGTAPRGSSAGSPAIAKQVRPHTLRHAFITAAQMGRIASDASFGSSREHALPAAQRAALRCPRPARPPRGCSDLGLHGPPGSDATTMQLIPLRGPHHHCACWHRDASGSSQLHPVHHRQTRRTAPGRHRSCKGRAGLPHHRSRHAPDLATSRSCCTRCIPAPGDGCSRGRQLARRAARHAGRPTRRGRGRHASQSPTGGRSWPGPATRLGRSVPVFTNLGSSLQAPR